MDFFTKIPTHKDQIEIEIEKLVPFGHRSFELFQGQRLEDTIDEIGEHEPLDIIDERIVGGAIIGIRILSPIIVRPAAGGQYEILDGHYRVAAARKLKKRLQLQSVKIPALIKNDLTDEETLSYVSETNPIGLLLKHGIDIFCDDYRETDGYKYWENALIFSYGNSRMALDEYVEHYLLDEHYVYDLHESIYDMGNPYMLTEEECSDEAVASEIVQLNAREDREETEKWKLSEEYSDAVALRAAQGTIEAEARELVHTFTRNDGGYILQLKKYLNFDLDAYDYNDIQNQRERSKILFFIYKLKKKFSGINIFQLLGRPSMENIDNSFLGWETSNGKYMKYIEHEIAKELSLTRKSNIRKAVAHVVDTWGDYMRSLCQDVEVALAGGVDCAEDVESILAHMQTEFVYQKSLDCKFIPPSPLDTFYLRLVQSECCGQMLDILRIYKMTYDTDYFVPSEYIKELRKLQSKHMSREDIENFFEPQNVRKVAKYVYLKDEITKEDRRRIRQSKKKVFRFLDFLKLADPFGIYNVLDDVTELLIISCLQAILLDSSNEIFDYDFHRFEGGKGSRNGKIRVQAALKRDGHIYDALQFYWVRHVMDRSYANVGDSHIRKATAKIEARCIEALLRVLNSSTIKQMLERSSYYLNFSPDTSKNQDCQSS